MNRLISIFSLVACLGVTGLRAQVITPADTRSSLLSGLQSTLGNLDRDTGDYAAALSPFVVREKKPVVIETADAVRAPAEPAGRQKFADETALQMIGDRFKPLGSMVLGNRGILQLGNGRTIEKGESFKAEIQGHVYEVQIAEVTSQGYTLSLGSASILKTFLTTTGATQ